MEKLLAPSCPIKQKTMKKKDLWQAITAELEINLSASNFSTWIAPCLLLEIKKVDKKRQILLIAVPSPFHKDIVENRYYAQIKEIADRLSDKKNELVFQVAPVVSKKKATGPLFALKSDKRKKILAALKEARLRPDFTFDTFAVSSTNEMAHAAAQAVARSPSKAYNPLLFYGGVGVGKTHLMQAIGQAILKKRPSTALIYCAGEEFTNEIIEAIRGKKTGEFKKKFRSVKVFLIDDIQFIAGKTKVQEEFFHTFNALQKVGGQIVMTSDKPPQEIEGLEERLRSRFEGGLNIDIQPPDFELRTAILLIKARNLKIKLPMDVAQLIAANIESTRQLEGFLVRLHTQILTRQEGVEPEMVKALLGQVNSRTASLHPAVSLQEIAKTVAAYFNLKLKDLKGPRRQKNVVQPRQVAMYLIRHDLKTTLQEIGRFFGKRDHTTVMHSVEKVTRELKSLEALRIDIGSIRKKLYG